MIPENRQKILNSVVGGWLVGHIGVKKTLVVVGWRQWASVTLSATTADLVQARPGGCAGRLRGGSPATTGKNNFRRTTSWRLGPRGRPKCLGVKDP